ncbi:hypothetical protein QR680_002274 [Steinernema hermaphroditum]|uniref:Anaphase-promoting complex subunit 4 WD40 domain-containing protein n=1 Tax=Steinernema hermaphroditum TaxID=289476 RepID=A0AA39H3U8_9BILA|nr:hypothetical protein QR680_002274 [Steinernema hermaphroditum]
MFLLLLLRCHKNITYRADTLKRRLVSDRLPQVPVCVTQAQIPGRGSYVYAGYTGGVTIVRNGRRVLKTIEISGTPSCMITFGNVLVLACQPQNSLNVFDAESGEPVFEMSFAEELKITSMSHPSTYLDKILVGFSNGQLHLINIKSGKIVHKFAKLKDATAVTCLEQTRLTDVYAIGFESGHICVYNIKYEKLLFSGDQEGSVTAVTFRTDGVDTMLTGNSSGCISVWSLDEKKLLGQLRESHKGRITSLHALWGQPFCFSTGSDNRIVKWVFDSEMSMPEVHTIAEGHSAQINCVMFYNDLRLLTAGADGSLRSFHAVRDDIFHNLGTVADKVKSGSHIKEEAIGMDIGWVRSSSWDDVVCIHKNNAAVSSWSTRRQAVGTKTFCHQRFYKSPRFVQHMASSIRLSSCGNMVFIGYTSGHLDVFNIQSGLYRGSFNDPSLSNGLQEDRYPRAHDYKVCGVESDKLNKTLISCDVNGIMKFWNLKEYTYEGMLPLSAGVVRTVFNRNNHLAAVAFTSGDIKIIDTICKTTVRHFKSAHKMEICALSFAPDGKWIVTADKQGYLKVWDLMAGSLIDAVKFEHTCIGLSFAENGTYLASVHEGQRAIYLWANMTLFGSSSNVTAIENDDSAVGLAALPSLPYDNSDMGNDSENDGGNKEIKEEVVSDDDYYDEKKSMDTYDAMAVQRMGSGENANTDMLIQFSGLPLPRWANLPDLDVIRSRNKPKEAPKKPENAPFFLPSVSTVGGFEFERENKDDQSAVIREKSVMAKRKLLEIDTNLLRNLLECSESIDGYLMALENLTQASISSIDFQIKSLPPYAFAAFFRMCRIGLQCTISYELIQSYLSVMLKYHSVDMWKTQPMDIADEEQDYSEKLNEEMRLLHSVLVEKWEKLESDLLDNAALINWIKNAMMTSWFVPLLLFLLRGTFGTHDEPEMTFEIYYEAGRQAYTEGDWAQCVGFLLRAVDDFRFYCDEVVWCREKCSRISQPFFSKGGQKYTELSIQYTQAQVSLCLLRCKQERFTEMRPAIRDIEIYEQFVSREPFKYLQFCYHKMGDLRAAVKYAYTHWIANPSDPDTLNNIGIFMKDPKFDNSMLVDKLRMKFEEKYLDGLDAYADEDWLHCIQNFETAFVEFLAEENSCRLLCDDKLDWETVNGFNPEMSIIFTSVYTSVLRCRSQCVEKLSRVNGRKIPNLLASIFEHLQICYYNVNRGRDAAEAVANALLLGRNSVVMRRNKFYYMNKYNRPELFEPTEASNVVELYERIVLEGRFLNFIDSRFKFENNMLPAETAEDRASLAVSVDIVDRFDYTKLETDVLNDGECSRLHFAAQTSLETVRHSDRLLRELEQRIADIYEVNVETSTVKCFTEAEESRCSHETVALGLEKDRCGLFLADLNGRGCVAVLCVH